MPIALIAALLPSLIGLAEKLLPRGEGEPSKGPEKKRLVTEILLANLDVLAAHGLVPSWVASSQADASLSGMIEFAVEQWNKKPSDQAGV